MAGLPEPYLGAHLNGVPVAAARWSVGQAEVAKPVYGDAVEDDDGRAEQDQPKPDHRYRTPIATTRMPTRRRIKTSGMRDWIRAPAYAPARPSTPRAMPIGQSGATERRWWMDRMVKVMTRH
jgi:hypothetical protein